jgi:hypothetical protein
MNRNSIALLVSAAVLLGLIAGGMVVRGDEIGAEVQWEYKTLRVRGSFSNAERPLNEYGKKGWEVVDWEDTGFVQVLLKRQI